MREREQDAARLTGTFRTSQTPPRPPPPLSTTTTATTQTTHHHHRAPPQTPPSRTSTAPLSRSTSATVRPSSGLAQPTAPQRNHNHTHTNTKTQTHTLAVGACAVRRESCCVPACEALHLLAVSVLHSRQLTARTCCDSPTSNSETSSRVHEPNNTQSDQVAAAMTTPCHHARTHPLPSITAPLHPNELASELGLCATRVAS
jgi:hypothetical protein